MAGLARGARVLLAALCIVAAVLLDVANTPAVAQRPAEAKAIADQQRQLLDRAFAELQPAANDKPRLYFVGFAGFGGQGVFKREVLAVRQLFDERFATKGHSIALINHPSTQSEVPLATAGNLARVLERLGREMDTSRDILFLFLTSHGTEGLLAIEMPGISLRHLRPRRLKQIIDRSGIRNVVLVVSACHSGSFIPTLASPTTLVIAAARADRSSFGCEDRRRWTYFGDAYFNKALREETSFRQAFARARRLITLWETRDGLMPSLPQIAGGEALPGID